MKIKGFDVLKLNDIIVKVLDSLSFSERWEKRKQFKELREAKQTLDDHKQGIFNKYKDSSMGAIPDSKLSLANKEFNKILNSHIDINLKTRFATKDLEKADLKEEDLMYLEKFDLI